LIGDSTDNVPGVPGIGPKAAATFIQVLGTLDEIYKLKDTPEALDEKLTKRLAETQAEIDKIAGVPLKVSSGTEIAKILGSKFGIKDLPLDKKGNANVDAAKLEELASSGNRLCELIIQARSISRSIGAPVRKLVDGEKSARLSKRLVTLDQNV